MKISTSLRVWKFSGTMSVSSIVSGKVSSRKAIIRNEPRESMILFVNRGSSSFSSVRPLPAAYSRTNARTFSFTASTELSELFAVILASCSARQVLSSKFLPSKRVSKGWERSQMKLLFLLVDNLVSATQYCRLSTSRLKQDYESSSWDFGGVLSSAPAQTFGRGAVSRRRC